MTFSDAEFAAFLREELRAYEEGEHIPPWLSRDEAIEQTERELKRLARQSER